MTANFNYRERRWCLEARENFTLLRLKGSEEEKVLSGAYHERTFSLKNYQGKGR
jgi:hypothetical protein